MEPQLRLLQTSSDAFPRLAPDSAGSGVVVPDAAHLSLSSCVPQVARDFGAAFDLQCDGPAFREVNHCLLRVVSAACPGR